MRLNSFTKALILTSISVVAFPIISRAAADATGLLLYVPFQRYPVPTVANGEKKLTFDNNVKITSGKYGSAGSVIGGKSQLVFDGPGNAYTEAGTVSFEWRLDTDPVGKGVTILHLSALEKTDKDPYMVLSYVAGKFELYLNAGNLGGQTLTSDPIMVLPGEWHQLLLCWDQTYGAVLLVDGQVALQFTKAWMYNGSIGSIALGATITPNQPPSTGFSQSFDEFSIYDRWLGDTNLEKLFLGNAVSSSELNTGAMIAQRLKNFQWNVKNAPKLPQIKLGSGGGIGLRQVNVDKAQKTGQEIFSGQRASFWPINKSTFNQTLPIIMSENEPFDIVQLLGIGRLTLTNDTDKKVFLNAHTQDLLFQSSVLQAPVSAKRTTLQTLPPEGSDTFKSSAAYNIQFFKQFRYPYEFDSSWQSFILRPASETDQPLDALLHIRQAFYSIDQQTFMAHEGAASGRVSIPAMHTFHVVGPAATQDQQLNAIAIELNLLPGTPGFARVQIADPQNPMHFLASADVHLNSGPGTMRLMIDNRDVKLPERARPIISITFSEDANIDYAGSSVRYQWAK